MHWPNKREERRERERARVKSRRNGIRHIKKWLRWNYIFFPILKIISMYVLCFYMWFNFNQLHHSLRAQQRKNMTIITDYRSFCWKSELHWSFFFICTHFTSHAIEISISSSLPLSLLSFDLSSIRFIWLSTLKKFDHVIANIYLHDAMRERGTRMCVAKKNFLQNATCWILKMRLS